MNHGHLRDFLHVAPPHNDHNSAIRRALCMLPLVVLLGMGRGDLVPFASLGALTAVYGRTEPHLRRLLQQVKGGLLLLTVMTLGIAAEHVHLAPLLLAACTAIVGAACFSIVSVAGIKPTNAIYYVLAFASVAFMPEPPRFGPALVVGGASVAFAWFVGVAGWVLPGHRTVSGPAEGSPDPSRPSHVGTNALLHLVAIGVAGVIAVLAGYGHSCWAMMVATVPLNGATAQYRLTRGMHRILGTFGGLLLAGVLFGAHLGGWGFAVAIVVLRFLMELFVRRHYALSQVFLTPLALLMTQVSDPERPWLLMRDRGIETLIGASVAMLLVLLVDRLSGRAEMRS